MSGQEQRGGHGGPVDRPGSWYHDGRVAAEAQVAADIEQGIHHREILSSHEGRPTVAEQRQRQGMAGPPRPGGDMRP